MAFLLFARVASKILWNIHSRFPLLSRGPIQVLICPRATLLLSIPRAKPVRLMTAVPTEPDPILPKNSRSLRPCRGADCEDFEEGRRAARWCQPRVKN